MHHLAKSQFYHLSSVSYGALVGKWVDLMAAAARRKRWEEHDFYDILGVACDASQDEIKRGFRTSAWLSSAQQAKELGGSENQRERERERERAGGDMLPFAAYHYISHEKCGAPYHPFLDKPNFLL